MNPTDLFTRHPSNPILTAADWPRPVNSVFNPGACRVGNDVVLLCRVEDTRGISHLWAARSDDGITNWRVDPQPLLSPRPGVEEEQWGFEDARISYVAELERWVILCTAYGPPGPCVFLATTDFDDIDPRGIVMPPQDKNAALLPRRIGGQWVLLHRPVTARSGPNAQVWLSRSRDMEAWLAPQRVMNTRDGAWWDSLRIGIGPPPIETEDGWLLIYHGVRDTVAGAMYRVGLALLDLEQPSKVLHRSDDWVLAPSELYERVGDVPNVVFPCGAAVEPDGGRLLLYYGAADTCVAVATAQLDELVDFVRDCPPDGAG